MKYTPIERKFHPLSIYVGADFMTKTDIAYNHVQKDEGPLCKKGFSQFGPKVTPPNRPKMGIFGI